MAQQDCYRDIITTAEQNPKAMQNLNPSICNKLLTQAEKDHCLAVATQNPSICDKIQNQELKNNCYDSCYYFMSVILSK